MNKKNFIFFIVGFGIALILNHYLKTPKISEQEKNLVHEVDSLKKLITFNNERITKLEAEKLVLDSQIQLDKNKLAKLAKEAETFKGKYNEEQTRINSMSNSDIVREFTAAFK